MTEYQMQLELMEWGIFWLKTSSLTTLVAVFISVVALVIQGSLLFRR
jgi:hypothetical protein